MILSVPDMLRDMLTQVALSVLLSTMANEAIRFRNYTANIVVKQKVFLGISTICVISLVCLIEDINFFSEIYAALSRN